MLNIKGCKIIALVAMSHLTVAPMVHAQMGNARPGQLAMLKDDKYEIVDIAVAGTNTLDPDLLKITANLRVGDKILLEDDPLVANAIKKLWDQKLLEDVRIDVVRKEDRRVWLLITVQERAKIGNVIVKGVRSTQETEIKGKLNLASQRMVTEALKLDMKETVKKYFREKGFSLAQVNIEEKIDPKRPTFTDVIISVQKGSKVKVNNVNIVGNEAVPTSRLRRAMRGTKENPRLSLKPAYNTSIYGVEEDRTFKSYVKNKGFLSLSKTLDILNPYFRYNIFASAKFDKEKYEEDKLALVEVFNNYGFRDAKIVSDTVYSPDGKHVNIDIKVSEGKRYYFGEIEYKGNSIYSDTTLAKVVNIKKGELYNRQKLESRLGLQPNAEGTLDVNSMYLDNGYLFFRLDAQEKSIINDTINYVVNIFEGPIATIKNVEFYGNLKTNDHVFRRELWSLPGNKFSRADIIRTVRQLSSLGFIDPEKVNPLPKPNHLDYTVDIDYNLTEKSTDQLEVSAGYSAYIGFTGSIGVVFNNFSLKNITKPKEWDPLPMGDGQKLSLRWQSSGLYYNSGNLTFTEPWLGGKKPNSLTFNLVWTRLSRTLGTTTTDDFKKQANDSYIKNLGGGVTFGKRLKWPDDYFIFSVGVNYQNYFLKNYSLYSTGMENFTNGAANNLFAKFTLARNSTDQQLYPRSGSNISFSAQITPPYSLLSEKDYSQTTDKEKFKWIEYHKYRFNADWYQKIYGNLVLKVSAKYGFLGYYNNDIGFSPFERFQLGGDGLSGYSFVVGKDIISHRGYEIYNENATIFNKYTVELRYPFSLNPSATIYGLMFADGAYAWNNIKQYNPLQMNRSVGAGLRIFLPMFGLLGLDYGIGIDRYQPGMNLGQYAKFTFMLGFEPE
jgi:outer membrane protein insertion porin family